MHKEESIPFFLVKDVSLQDLHRVGRLVVAMVLPMSSSSEDPLGLVEMGDEIMLFFLKWNDLDELYEW